MENREQLILAEIKSLMSSVRSQLELLDAKMAELQQIVEPDAIDVVPIDLDINIDEPFAPEIAAEPELVEQQIPMGVDDDLPFDDLPEPEHTSPEPAVEVTPVEEPVSEQEISEQEETVVPESVTVDKEPVVEQISVEAESVISEVATDVAVSAATEPTEADDEEPLLMSEPEPVKMAEVLKAEAPKAVIDVMTDKYAWRTDMPGTAVKDIRSAISLNDRIIFINYLFDEDPMLFQDALTRINQMTSLDEVVEYAVNEHPEWDLSSEVIYRFMMAVRRRIR